MLVQWGDVPTWVGAVGAIGAAWFAFQTIKSQREQIGEQREFIAEQSLFMAEQQQNLELERAEFRAQAEERKVSQARQVVMSFHTPGAHDHWAVKVKNASDDAIHSVMVRFGEAYNALNARDEAGFYHPDGGRRAVPVDLIPAGHTVVFESPQMSEATVDNNRPALLFTDDSGVRWRRDSYGKLEETPADGTS